MIVVFPNLVENSRSKSGVWYFVTSGSLIFIESFNKNLSIYMAGWFLGVGRDGMFFPECNKGIETVSFVRRPPLFCVHDGRRTL
jgi:hypothetical protein